MAKTSSHAFIGGSRRTGSRGGYHRKPATNGDGEGLKPSEIIAASTAAGTDSREYQRDKRKKAD